MRSREKRFGSEWFVEGHHPESEFRLLKEEMRPLWKQLRDLIFKNQSAIEELLLELSSAGLAIPGDSGLMAGEKNPGKAPQPRHPA